MHQLSISQKSRGQFDPLYPSNGGPEEEFNFLHTGIARHFFGTFFFFCILPLYIYLVIRGNETLKQSQGVPPYGTRSYVTSQPDFKRRDYDLIALRVTQSAYFSLLTHTKKLLLVTFCDLTAETGVSFRTHGRRTDGRRKDRQTLKSK